MRSRQVIPLTTKYSVLQALDNGEKRSVVRRRFGLKNYANINRIIGQREKIIQLHGYLKRGRIPMALTNRAMAFSDLVGDEDQADDVSAREVVARLGLHVKIGDAIVKELQQSLPRVDEELHSFELELDDVDGSEEDAGEENAEEEQDEEDDNEDAIDDEADEEEDDEDGEENAANQVGSGLAGSTKLAKQLQALLLQVKIVGGIIGSLSEWEDKLMADALRLKAAVEKDSASNEEMEEE